MVTSVNLPVSVDEMTLAAGFFSDLGKFCLAETESETLTNSFFPTRSLCKWQGVSWTVRPDSGQTENFSHFEAAANLPPAQVL